LALGLVVQKVAAPDSHPVLVQMVRSQDCLTNVSRKGPLARLPARSIAPVPAVHLGPGRHSLSRRLARIVPAAEGAVNLVVLVGVLRLLRSIGAPAPDRPLAPSLRIARRQLPALVTRQPARFSGNAWWALGSGRHLRNIGMPSSLRQAEPVPGPTKLLRPAPSRSGIP